MNKGIYGLNTNMTFEVNKLLEIILVAVKRKERDDGAWASVEAVEII